VAAGESFNVTSQGTDESQLVAVEVR